MKYGFSNNLDDNEDDQIKITGIEDYTSPSAERESLFSSTMTRRVEVRANLRRLILIIIMI